jgi:hypothetical protein
VPCVDACTAWFNLIIQSHESHNSETTEHFFCNTASPQHTINKCFLLVVVVVVMMLVFVLNGNG